MTLTLDHTSLLNLRTGNIQKCGLILHTYLLHAFQVFEERSCIACILFANVL